MRHGRKTRRRQKQTYKEDRESKLVVKNNKFKSIFSIFFVIWVRRYHNLWNSFPVEFPWFLLGDQIDHRKELTNERLLKEEEKIVKLRVTRNVRLNLELKLLGIMKSLWKCMFRNNYRLCVYYLIYEVYGLKEVLGWGIPFLKMSTDALYNCNSEHEVCQDLSKRKASCNLLPNCNFIENSNKRKTLIATKRGDEGKRKLDESYCIAFLCTIWTVFWYMMWKIYYINLTRVRNWCYVISKEQCQRAEMKTMFSLEEKNTYLLICNSVVKN